MDLHSLISANTADKMCPFYSFITLVIDPLPSLTATASAASSRQVTADRWHSAAVFRIIMAPLTYSVHDLIMELRSSILLEAGQHSVTSERN